MNPVANFLSAFSGLSMDHVNALIALAALGVAGLAIHVVFSLSKGQRRS